ncbi:dynamin-2A-like [Pistacia vera]|uniref:dynamin-2A-like n=1 Tax=Pistacia vera TaxID=55513 RepID=UPI001263A188|nr:dynamin-2A-like [Pistacia vera]
MGAFYVDDTNQNHWCNKFLQHMTTGFWLEKGWQFLRTFPNRFKQRPLDRHFEINNVKRVLLAVEAHVSIGDYLTGLVPMSFCSSEV